MSFCYAFKKDGKQCRAYANCYCEDCGMTFCWRHIGGRFHGKDKCPDTRVNAHGY